MTLLWFLIIGALAGWIAGILMKGGGFGLIGNLVVGIVGSFIGGNLLGLLGITAGGLVGTLAAAVIGACVLLFIVGLLKKA
ncbi:MAG: GlsB/YeaQ/YmgE family stress response membrane protein [Blastocatellales bacterium]